MQHTGSQHSLKYGMEHNFLQHQKNLYIHRQVQENVPSNVIKITHIPQDHVSLHNKCLHAQYCHRTHRSLLLGIMYKRGMGLHLLQFLLIAHIHLMSEQFAGLNAMQGILGMGYCVNRTHMFKIVRRQFHRMHHLIMDQPMYKRGMDLSFLQI